jgi:hypothetical protein
MPHGPSTGSTDADMVGGVPQGGEEIFAGEGASAATMDKQTQTVAYQAPPSKMIQPSLIDFLR